MLDKDTIVVLGAQDPEMREIEQLLASDRRPWLHAARGRQRCSAQTAYAADAVVRLGRDGVAHPGVLPPKAPAVFVECTVHGRAPLLRVDHHHPGDPGYAVPPERYLEGASLGQMLRLLEREATETQRLLAAADHCLTAAYQGQCTGVDPHEPLFLRASWQAKISGRSLSDVIDGILDASKRVRRHYDSQFTESRFLDPTRVPRDLPEGAAHAGVPVRYRALLPDGSVKEMLKGASPERIERFIAEHDRAGRVTYGNPHRGYAGSYWPAD